MATQIQLSKANQTIEVSRINEFVEIVFDLGKGIESDPIFIHDCENETYAELLRERIQSIVDRL